MNKHILLYTDDFGLGGVAHYNHSLLCGLATLGYRVSCVQTRSSNPLVSRQQELGIHHFWLEFDTSKEFYRTLTNLSDARNIFSNASPDLIIFSNCCPLSNFAAKQLAIELEIPYIVVEGFAAPYLAERFAAFLDKLQQHYVKAKAILTNSQENLSLLHKLFRLSEGKGKVIYLGRSQEYFTPPQSSVRDRLRQEFKIPKDAVVCFTAARLEGVKGFQYQLAAIGQLKSRAIWHKIYFVWVGTGSLELQLKEAVKQLGVANRVKILGQRWDVADWLDASDIFTLTSEIEPFGLANVEAMAKKLPVVATRVGGIPEVLGDTGKLLADPTINPQSTVRELVTTIELWVENPELRFSLGESCKKRAEEMFVEERMIKETVAVIEEVLKGSLVSANQSRDKTDIINNNPGNKDNFQAQLSRISNCIHQYQKSPDKAEALVKLREFRAQIAQKWLNLPAEQLAMAYRSDFGKAHQMLLNSGIRDEKLTSIK